MPTYPAQAGIAYPIVSFPAVTTLTRSVDPTTTLATLPELKAWAGVTANDSDTNTRLTICLGAASDGVEEETDRLWRAQTFVQTFNRWQHCYLLDKQATSVAVKYYDTANTLQTVSTSNYYYLSTPSPKIIFANTYSFPDHFARPDCIQITLTQTEHTVSPIAKALCCALANELSENRETNIAGTINANPEYDRMRRLLRRGMIG